VNLLERAILAVAPTWAETRAKSRLKALAYSVPYEAVKPTRLRKEARDHGSGNMVAGAAAVKLRNTARNLERNHDLARGVLNALVQNTIGPAGIGVEPTPIGGDGEIDEALQDQLRPLWDEWTKRPEVTFEHDWPSAQRLLARSWYRDGDVLYQDLRGPIAALDHGTVVPYSIELIEADLLPHDFNDPARNIVQGVERNAWNRAVAFHLYKQHPVDVFSHGARDMKRVSAAYVHLIKLVDRIGQVRGVSAFASVLTRLDDLKNYEESERVAAMVAASMTAFIQKGKPEDYDVEKFTDSSGNETTTRHLQFKAGMVFDDLRPGESVGTIDTNRPNPNAAAWRNGQLRAIAAGAGVSYSTAARDYNGTYSAQRQELVEQWGAYGLLSFEFVNQCVRRVYETFATTALLSGRVQLPAGMTEQGFLGALYQPPAMPWIDPKKELEAFAIAEDRCYLSGPEIIRRRGGNPRDVRKAEAKWRRDLEADGLGRAPAAANDPAPPPAPDEPEKEETANA
jgi:lambda family phage portal protein